MSDTSRHDVRDSRSDKVDLVTEESQEGVSTTKRMGTEELFQKEPCLQRMLLDPIINQKGPKWLLPTTSLMSPERKETFLMIKRSSSSSWKILQAHVTKYAEVAELAGALFQLCMKQT